MTRKNEQRSSERRVVTALFCDVVGSTSLAETMDPEDWADIVNQMVSNMAQCVERYGGTVAQFAGDSILAIFGAPVAHEDDPYRAVRAGLDILEKQTLSRHTSDEIAVRAGIHTGLVVMGDVNAGGLSTYTALGDTPNVAARMQTMATPGSLFVSADTYRLVANDVTARDLGPVEMKGKSKPINVFEVTGAHHTSLRRRGIPGFVSPMVGRDDELARLVELVEYAEAGSGRVSAIVGQAGVGKSRLLSELKRRVVAIDNARWVVGRSVSYDQHRPYHLAASLVLALAGSAETDSHEIIRKAVMEVAEPLFGPASPSTDHLLQLLGITAGHPDDDPAVLHSQYDTALAALISGLAAEHAPLVLVCEDAHWADASSAELLSGLIDRVRQSGTLLVVVSRPDRKAHGWDIISQAQRELGEAFVDVQLQPLGTGHSRQLVANLLEIESLSDSLRDLVLSRSEGNPFFIEEIVRMLVDRDLIAEVDGHWVASSEISSLDVPDTLHGLLASRLDNLDPPVRRVAMLAAVIGRRFENRLLASVLESGEGDIAATAPAALGVLEAQGLIKLVATRPELAFSFRHALTHDVTYQSILRKDRRQFHTAVGDAIAHIFADRLDEQAPTLARHYEEAGEFGQALRYLLLAGETASTRHAMPESHDFYSRAAALIDADPDATDELKIGVALSRAAAGMNFTPAEQTISQLEAVRGLAEDLGDPEAIARVYALLLRIRTMLEENYADPDFREVMDRASALTPQLADGAVRAYLEGMVGEGLRSSDRYAAAKELLGGSVAPLEAAGRVGEAGWNAALAADVEASQGNFEEAYEWIERAATLAAASGNPNVAADVELLKGRIAAARGELETALNHTRTGTELAEGAGNIQCTLVGNFMVADQQLRIGDAEAAIPHLERTFELGAYCNADAMVALGHAWLATARAQLGEHDPEAFSEPLEAAQLGGSRSGEAAVRLQRGIAVAGGPDPDWELVIGDFERAIELFNGIGARPDEARATHAYANALEAAGQGEASSAQLANAMAMFVELGIRPDRMPA